MRQDGLLKIRDGVAAVHYFVAYDGNGNVAGLVSGATGIVAARYEYGPFGEVMRASGTMAKANPIRSSSKYSDDETDFIYYGYRYYNPSTGRWLSRDPGVSGRIKLTHLGSLQTDPPLAAIV